MLRIGIGDIVGAEQLVELADRGVELRAIRQPVEAVGVLLDLLEQRRNARLHEADVAHRLSGDIGGDCLGRLEIAAAGLARLILREGGCRADQARKQRRSRSNRLADLRHGSLRYAVPAS